MAHHGSPHSARPAQVEHRARPRRLLQLTDLHLVSDPRGRLFGRETRSDFESVLALARRGRWPPDALCLTGDLVHDESPEAYRYLREWTERLGVPCWSLSGNHDRLDLLAGHLDASALAGMRVEPLGPWDVLLLDSSVPFEDGGHLARSVLRDLESHLAVAAGRPQILFLHHHPCPIGSPWIDTMCVDNGGELFEIASRHRSLRAVVCGHVHQVYDGAHRGVRWMATPSTCAQFLPLSMDFALDDSAPGYRWLELHADGRIETGVVRIDS